MKSDLKIRNLSHIAVVLLLGVRANRNETPFEDKCFFFLVLIFLLLRFLTQVTYRWGQLIWVVDRHLSWVPFMNFARCPEEQNVEVFLSDGSFFFRTIDRVARGEELLIWPTEGLCRSLRIPHLVAPRKNERKQSFLIF